MTRIKQALAVLLALCLAAALPVSALGEEETLSLTPLGDSRFLCEYGGTTRRLLIDLPEEPAGSGLILMLHGYGGTAESFHLDTGFAEAALERGYTVVWVTGTPDPAVPTSATGWRYENGGTDVAFLSALAEAVQRDYQTDETRTFAIGFSNGAFMAHCLAAEAGDTFSAVVSVAGAMDVSVWENRPETCRVSFLQISGEKDAVVPKNSDGSARYARDPAIEDVIAWYADGLSLCETTPIGHASVLTSYTDDATGRTVWHLRVKDGRHSWSSERFTGIDTNALILDFLQIA